MKHDDFKKTHEGLDCVLYSLIWASQPFERVAVPASARTLRNFYCLCFLSDLIGNMTSGFWSRSMWLRNKCTWVLLKWSSSVRETQTIFQVFYHLEYSAAPVLELTCLNPGEENGAKTAQRLNSKSPFQPFAVEWGPVSSSSSQFFWKVNSFMNIPQTQGNRGFCGALSSKGKFVWTPVGDTNTHTPTTL